MRSERQLPSFLLFHCSLSLTHTLSSPPHSPTPPVQASSSSLPAPPVAVAASDQPSAHSAPARPIEWRGECLELESVEGDGSARPPAAHPGKHSRGESPLPPSPTTNWARRSRWSGAGGGSEPEGRPRLAGWLAGTRESPERKGRDDTTVIGAAPPVVRASELTMAKPDCRRKDWGPLRQAASKLDC